MLQLVDPWGVWGEQELPREVEACAIYGDVVSEGKSTTDFMRYFRIALRAPGEATLNRAWGHALRDVGDVISVEAFVFEVSRCMTPVMMVGRCPGMCDMDTLKECYAWALSRKVRNQKQHAINGNGAGSSGSSSSGGNPDLVGVLLQVAQLLQNPQSLEVLQGLLTAAQGGGPQPTALPPQGQEQTPRRGRSRTPRGQRGRSRTPSESRSRSVSFRAPPEAPQEEFRESRATKRRRAKKDKQEARQSQQRADSPPPRQSQQQRQPPKPFPLLRPQQAQQQTQSQKQSQKQPQQQLQQQHPQQQLSKQREQRQGQTHQKGVHPLESSAREWRLRKTDWHCDRTLMQEEVYTLPAGEVEGKRVVIDVTDLDELDTLIQSIAGKGMVATIVCRLKQEEPIPKAISEVNSHASILQVPGTTGNQVRVCRAAVAKLTTAAPMLRETKPVKVDAPKPPSTKVLRFVMDEKYTRDWAPGTWRCDQSCHGVGGPSCWERSPPGSAIHLQCVS